MAMLSQKAIEQFGFASLGENVLISDKASIYNPAQISLGSNVRIDDFCVLSPGIGGIEIGDHIHIAIGSSLIGAGKITLSGFCNISSRVSIYSSNDDYSGTTMTNPTIPRQYTNVTNDNVFVGKHVIIGSGSVILPGVIIEDGVAIGALSFVSKNCTAFGVYAGCPVKRIKERKQDLLTLESLFLSSKNSGINNLLDMDEQKENFSMSVLLITYNHEKYIDKALTSLFQQVTDDSIELVIADDASTDNTLAIIKQYENKDARFHFKYLSHTTNHGITKNYQRGFSACSGKYIAVLEGDDYWITPYKLQQQRNFLDTHWECDLCAVNYFVFEENSLHFYPRMPIGKEYRLLSARELIADNIIGNFSTCMYRKSAIEALPEELYEICSYDWIVNICVTGKSLAGFLEEPMSVYRLHANGAWSQASPLTQLKKQMDLIPGYDKLTNNVYQKEFLLLTQHLKHIIFQQPARHFFSRAIHYISSRFLKITCTLLPAKFKFFLNRILRRGLL